MVVSLFHLLVPQLCAAAFSKPHPLLHLPPHFPKVKGHLNVCWFHGYIVVSLHFFFTKSVSKIISILSLSVAVFIECETYKLVLVLV